MRHNKNFNHLGRQAGHRKALMSNMASSLILHKRIETTVAKAKAVRQFIEPLVTKSKDDSTHSRRIVFSYLKQKEAVTELFRTIAPKIAERPGGYTRILKTGFRLGDAADMCIIEFVDFNDAYTLGIAPAAAAEASPKTRRAPGYSPQPKKTDAVEESYGRGKAKPRRPHLKRLPLRRLRSPRLEGICQGCSPEGCQENQRRREM
ncbi:MAG: 50S ribosomal protein L17 [Alistipes onderdonkii]